jgi:cysteine synthase/rhodanese-related sulfurtransferase
MRYNHITELIGNTPILEIDPKVHGLKNIQLFAKLEYFNPFGSVKDRIAWAMLKDELPRLQNEERTVIEASSGNTGKALQVLSSVYGLKFKAFTNRARVPEVKDVLSLLGTDIEEVPRVTECPDPTMPDNVFNSIEKMIEDDPDKYFHTSQYTNEKNVQSHYDGTGKEIHADVGQIDYFFGGLGTTGSTRGTAMFLKEKNPHVHSIGVVSSPEDFIPGIRSTEEMWEVGLFDKSFYEAIVDVTSEEAIDAMVSLNRESGILAGPTSGAVYAATLLYLKNIDQTLTKPCSAVFIACDRVEWYISYIRARRPDLFGEKKVEAVVSEKEIIDAPIISADECLIWIKKINPLIIDIRANLAYRTGHIENSINIDQEYLEKQLTKMLPFERSRDILVVCPLGEKSKRTVALLKQCGYNAKNLEGGIVAWRNSGKELIKF